MKIELEGTLIKMMPENDSERDQLNQLALAKPAARVWLANWAKDRFLPLPDPFQSTDPAHTP